MPEFPEVYTISQDLKKNITGYTVKGIQISTNYKLPTTIKAKLKSLIGKKIVNTDNIAKNIVLELSENMYLVFHLAMTGRILLRELGSKPDNWVKVSLQLEKDNKKRLLRFADMRQFGKVLVLNKKELDNLVNKYGLNPLDKDATPEKFLKVIRSKRTNIKNLLLDQKVIAGVGNIYATDALFLSKIHPKISTQNLDLESTTTLLNSIKEVLKEGIKNRGSTLPDKMYVDIFGKEGKQQNYFKIYLKQTCPNCNSKVEIIKINGRRTYFCPTCQILLSNKNSRSTKENLNQKKLL